MTKRHSTNLRIIGRRYRLGSSIASVGGVEIVLGFDQQMHRPVLISIVSNRDVGGRDALARLSDEIALARGVQHRNLLTIFDLVRVRETLYVVQEYAPSESLREIIDAEGPFHPDDVSILVEQVAAAISAIDQADLPVPAISAESISVDEAGLVRIAPIQFQRPRATLGDSDLERASQSELVRALAGIAYEMLTGQLPETTDASGETGLPIEPSEIRPELSPRIDPIILAGFSNKADAKFEDANDFAIALSKWEALPHPPTPLRRRSRPDPVFAAAEALPHIEEQPFGDHNPTPFDNLIADTTPADRSNLVTWVASLAVLLTLIALIAYFSQRIGDDDSPDNAASVTPTAVTTVATSPVNVPNIVGMTLTDARSTLWVVGLEIMVTGDPVTSVTERVQAQQPAAGVESHQGATVEVTMGATASPIDVVSLNLVGKLATDAQRSLESAGVSVSIDRVKSEPAMRDVVLSVSPEGEVQPGDEVTLTVGGGDQVEIPISLQGAPLADARDLLEPQGIVVETIGVAGSVIEQGGIDLDAAEIADQDVVGIQGGATSFGVSVAPGTSVTLVYYDAAMDEASQ